MDELAGLARNEQRAVRAFIARVREECGSRVLQTTLFGSRARGDGGRDSDVDILLVVDSEDWRLHKALRVLAARVSLEYNVLLSPRIIGQDRWAEMRRHHFTLYEHIQADGIALMPVG